MPPKAKFTKQEIANAALQIYREEGMDALTSRNPGSSACPIFTVFSTAEKAQNAMVDAAKMMSEIFLSLLKNAAQLKKNEDVQ